MTDMTRTLASFQLPRSLSAIGSLLVVLALAVSLSACNGDDGPEPPELVDPIDDQQIAVDENREVADLNAVFDGEALSFSAFSENSNVVAAQIDGQGVLLITPNSVGEAEITYVAENESGDANGAFNVEVEEADIADPPEPPNGD